MGIEQFVSQRQVAAAQFVESHTNVFFGSFETAPWYASSCSPIELLISP